MTSQPSRDALRGSEALAKVLREHPPALDDLARARMEKRLLAADRSPARGAPRRSGRALIAAGGALALAAALVLAVLAAREEPTAPVARFERREATASVERGTLEEGSSLRTAADEVAEIAVADSRVRIGGASRVRIAGLSRERIALQLDAGTVEVAFHPRARGSERMTVETPDARVEVVGTVFRVTSSAGATEVSVSEGTVRVVPLGGGDARLVHAGDSTRVARELAGGPEEVPSGALAEADVAPAEVAEPEVAEPEVVPSESAERDTQPAAADAPEPSRAPTPEARLAEARRLRDGGRASAALRILRQLTGPSVPVDVRVGAWELMGDVHQSARRFPEAARAYESAAREGRGSPAGHNAIYALARLQHRFTGDHDAARASYARYLEEAPRGALASQARRALCTLGVSEHCQEVP